MVSVVIRSLLRADHGIAAEVEATGCPDVPFTSVGGAGPHARIDVAPVLWGLLLPADGVEHIGFSMFGLTQGRLPASATSLRGA